LASPRPWPPKFSPSAASPWPRAPHVHADQAWRRRPLKLLWWQGPTLLNPHFATGTKDQTASRIFYEPLASWDVDGHLNPILAAEIPSIQNGGLAADAKSVTWKLKPGVKWHDGKPFTADDVVFNWEYATDPATAAVSSGAFGDATVEKVDDLTVRILFKVAHAVLGQRLCRRLWLPHPETPVRRLQGRQIPGSPRTISSRWAPALQIRRVQAGRPDPGRDQLRLSHPQTVHTSTQSSSRAAAMPSRRRAAIIQTGEYDYAWNMQVEDEVLLRLEKGGKGKTIYAVGGDIEFIAVNSTDPNTEVDGERSSIEDQASASVRSGRAQGAGAAGRPQTPFRRSSTAAPDAPPPTTSTAPRPFVSRTRRGSSASKRRASCWDDAGWKPGADGVREKTARS